LRKYEFHQFQYEKEFSLLNGFLNKNGKSYSRAKSINSSYYGLVSMVLSVIEVSSTSRQQFIDITDRVEGVVNKSGVKNGVCFLYVPHTTAGITINENADPSVVTDIIETLERVIPLDGRYRHLEGNAHAHIKSSILGHSACVLIEDGRLMLGTWQGVFLCEFDGPRRRKVLVKIIEEKV
jgi:secondary thiamine-phosphate synthase enzyme